MRLTTPGHPPGEKRSACHGPNSSQDKVRFDKLDINPMGAIVHLLACAESFAVPGFVSRPRVIVFLSILARDSLPMNQSPADDL